MGAEERDVVMSLMMKGFNDLATEASTRVTGGQTVINAWPLIGGVAMSVCKEEDLCRPENLVAGDVLVLTKPLGTQVAVNCHQWSRSDKWKRVEDLMSKEEAKIAYDKAMDSMSRLNRTAARLMHKYGCHGATDITGFGYLGHASNLAAHQKAEVDLILETFPIIEQMKTVDDKLNMFKLMKGFSAETSGGLLMALPSEDAAKSFCEEIQRIDGKPAWIVGRVVAGSRSARVAENPAVIEV
jgi:selenide,water dikinase